MRFGLDLDGCVYDWVGTVKDAFRERGYEGEGWETPDIPSWNWFTEGGGVSDADWRWLWETKTGLAAAFGSLEALPGAIDAVRSISKITDLAVITHRPRRVAAATATYLAHHEIVFDSLHILGPRTAKSEVQPQADIYVEDKVENVLDLFENTNAYAIYVPRRPWNQDGRLPEDERRIRFFDNWNQVVVGTKRLDKSQRRERELVTA